MENILVDIVLLFLAGIVGYLVVLIRKALVNQIGQDNYDMMNKVIEDIVRYIEQMGLNLGWSNEDKKRLAVNLCHAAIEKLGYPVDEELIERLIERAVEIINENTIRIDTIKLEK